MIKMSETLFTNGQLIEASDKLAVVTCESIIKEFSGSSDDAETSPVIDVDLIIKKARRRKTEAKRKSIIFTLMKSAAVIIMALGITAGTIYFTDQDTWAKMVSWTRTFIQEKVTLHFTEDDNYGEMPTPIIGWLPEGFKQIQNHSQEGLYLSTYFEDENGNGVSIDFNRRGTLSIMEIGTSEDNAERVYVNGNEAEYYETLVDGEANLLVWEDENNNVVCTLGAALTKEDIIKIAENISYE